MVQGSDSLVLGVELSMDGLPPWVVAMLFEFWICVVTVGRKIQSIANAAAAEKDT